MLDDVSQSAKYTIASLLLTSIVALYHESLAAIWSVTREKNLEIESVQNNPGMKSTYSKWEVCMLLQVSAAATTLWAFEPVDYPCCNDRVLNRTIHFCFQVMHEMQIMSDVGIAIDKVLQDQIRYT